MRGDYKTYDLIAIHAGRHVGLRLPTLDQASARSAEERAVLVKKVADSKRARKKRDELYVDFERRLRDAGYKGDQVWRWFQKTYGPISRSSIFRARAMLRALRKRFLPNKVVLLRPDAKSPAITRIAPYTTAQTSIDGKATAYVCRDFACRAPTTDAAKMLELLGVTP